MRESLSQHVFQVKLYRDSSQEYPIPYCEDLDFEHLGQFLTAGQIVDDEQEEPVMGSKKRRLVKPKNIGKGKEASSVMRKYNIGLSSKRAKLDEDAEVDAITSTASLFRHVFEIALSFSEQIEPISEINGRYLDLDPVAIDSLRFLEQNAIGREAPVTLDLGMVHPQTYSTGEVFLCTTEYTSYHTALSTRLLTLPVLEDVSGIDYDFHIGRLGNMVASACAMQRSRRAKISTTLQITVASPLQLEKTKVSLPITLRITLDFSLVIPICFKPLDVRARPIIEEEAQRRVLIFLSGSDLAKPENYIGSTNMRFFLSCLQPAPVLTSVEAYNAVQPKELRAQLLPFQRRSVAWLLSREGKVVTQNGDIKLLTPDSSTLPLFWEKVMISDDQEWYFNRITGQLLSDPPPEDDFYGGILAEEPGLGKTLECIALILLNPSPSRNPTISRWDSIGIIDVKEVKTTLIITPTSLAQQWIDEIKTHAPSLRVFVYEGWTKVPVPITDREAKNRVFDRFRQKRKVTRLDEADIPDEDDCGNIELTEEEVEELQAAGRTMTWCSFISQYDVCITTYHTLQQDLEVARPPIQRPRRSVATYSTIERDRSPLIMAEWCRVIMDEVQMVGGGKAEEMVSLIPRLSSFAVSGTPARAAVQDLIHVIKFLRIDAVTRSPKTWYRLQHPNFAASFKDLFERVAIRTEKAEVQSELTIPQQRRYVVPIELGRIERHVYDQNLEQALMDLGLDVRGVAAASSWSLDVSVLRNWVKKLRGICTHPQVGQLASQKDRWLKAGSGLKSIAEVLEGMKDSNWRELISQRKSKLQVLAKKAQLITYDETDPERLQRALIMLININQEADDLCKVVELAIFEHDAKGESLKLEARLQDRITGSIKVSETSDKGKGRERQEDATPTEDLGDDGLPKTPAGEEYKHKKNALQSRLRECLIVRHQVHFLLGNIYHVLGEPYTTQEDEEYAIAENIRKDLLKTTEQVANQSIAQLKQATVGMGTIKKSMVIDHCEKGGILSDSLLREADDIIDVLNDQTVLIFEWRTRLLGLLTESLSANDGEQADGQEYSRTLETQGDAEILLQEYTTLLADRREVLVAERTVLAAHDSQEKKSRKTLAAVAASQAADLDSENMSALLSDELQPVHEVLQSELASARKKIRSSRSKRAIKSIVTDLIGAISNIIDDNDPEKIIGRRWIAHLKSIIKEHTIFHQKLEPDLTHFRKAFNDRILYFRQLQELSDTVSDVLYEGTLPAAIRDADSEIEKINNSIAKTSARKRYLENLANNKDEDEDNICILCKCEFTRGFITQCAHVYCEGCMKAWFSRRENKTCPVCRVIVNSNQLQRVTMKEKKLQAESQEQASGTLQEGPPKSKRIIDYNEIEPEVFDEILKIESLGSYGSKIQTLVRHLLYLQEVDPGCKSIVFSSWADSLFIIERALTENGIDCLRIDQRKGKSNVIKLFKEDPRIQVLLLHGERENSGLNVTCASRVFLVESVVQHAFEIQAIARIDRMGQSRPTEVYCYYAENSVERNILDLAARRDLSLYTKDHATGSLNVASLGHKSGDDDEPVNVKKQKGQKGDFIWRADDMLAILFPHMFEDLEHLLPENSSDINMLDAGGIEPDDYHTMNDVPTAGPSRIQ